MVYLYAKAHTIGICAGPYLNCVTKPLELVGFVS